MFDPQPYSSTVPLVSHPTESGAEGGQEAADCIIRASLFCLAGLRALEEQHVRLRLVDHVVHPPLRLLNAELAPLRLMHESGAGDELGEVLGQNDVPVLVCVVVVLVAVEDLALQLFDDTHCLHLGFRVQRKVVMLRAWHWEGRAFLFAYSV